MKTYKEYLIDAMSILAKNNKVLFIGQGTRYTGHAIYHSIKHIDEKKRIEMPVCEELQTG